MSHDTREFRIELALRAVLDLIDRNVLVRNPSEDSRPDWFKRATEVVMTLKEAKDALDEKGSD